MPSIRILPTHLVNKIAAGEVIERPASIVKELVENAIDAGATQIDVQIEDGGRKLIAVSDDGCGMDEQDLALVFAPHATSKIAAEDDLFNIHTMGFRGEAMASIASVSHAHVRTAVRGMGVPPMGVAAISRPLRGQDGPATHGQALGAPYGDARATGGHEIEASGQQIGQVRPCPAAPGTTVTIRDIFFNTPARLKFMKGAPTEFGHIAEQVTRLALPHPQIAFTLTHNGRCVQKLPHADSTPPRVLDLFGPEVADGLLPLRRRGQAVSVLGLIGPPRNARATGKWQYVFLNGRYIRDRLLGHAIREGYRGLVDPTRWPVAFVFLDVDPSEVDVNVHPTKIEVRFRDTQLVHGELLAAIKETLNRRDLAPGLAGRAGPVGRALPDTTAKSAAAAPTDVSQTLDEAADAARAHQSQIANRAAFAAGAADLDDLAPSNPQSTIAPQGIRMDRNPQSTDSQQRRDSLRAAMADFFKSVPPNQPRFNFGEPSGTARQGDKETGRQGDTPEQPQYGLDDPAAANVQSAIFNRQSSIDNRQFPLMQIHNSYIVAATPEGLLIVDQHALHERLIYNDLKRRLTDGQIQGQRLLIPQSVDASPADIAAVEGHSQLLASLGIEAASFGPSALAIQQFPAILSGRGVDAAQFLREILDKLADDETADAERLLERILETIACKAAVKAGDPLAPQEMESLLSRLNDADKSSSCPHGRPTTLKLTLRDLEKQFKRT